MKFEFSKKRGFYKFGTKNMMIDKNHPEFGFAIDIFLNKYEKGLKEVFNSNKYRDTLSFVCFAELVGKKSEYGHHYFGDDEFDIVLFDIAPYKKNFIPPNQFVSDFKHLDIPSVVYVGNLNREFVKDVKENKFGLKEGVVCKGVVKKDELYYCKIKTNEWLDKLRSKYTNQYEQEISQMKEVSI